MQRMEQDPEELKGSAAPRQSESDRPPVGEPLVVSRRNPAARPAGVEAVDPAGDSASSIGPDPLTERRPEHRPALDGLVALVTGAAGELGTALAWELVDRGARVLLVDEDLDDLLDLTDALAFGRAVALRCDLRSESDVSAVCGFVSRAAKVDVVVHVGGGGAGDVGSDVASALDHRYRSEIRGPLALIEGLGSALGSAPRVLLVERHDTDRDSLSAAAPAVLREHLLVVGGVEVSGAVCGADLDADVFADAVVDLVSRDDLALDSVHLVGPTPAV